MTSVQDVFGLNTGKKIGYSGSYFLVLSQILQMNTKIALFKYEVVMSFLITTVVRLLATLFVHYA